MEKKPVFCIFLPAVVFTLVLCLACRSSAAEGTASVLEDPRLQTNAVVPVLKSRLQIVPDYVRYNTLGQNFLVTLRPAVSFGPAKQFLFQLAIPYQWKDVDNANKMGFGDIGIKFAAVDYRSDRLTVGWDTELIFPTGNEDKGLGGLMTVLVPEWGMSYVVSESVVFTVTGSFLVGIKREQNLPPFNHVMMQPTPIFLLPYNSYLVFNTRLEYDLENAKWIPRIKTELGKIYNTGREFGVSLFYEVPMNEYAKKNLEKYRVGSNFVWYF